MSIARQVPPPRVPSLSGKSPARGAGTLVDVLIAETLESGESYVPSLKAAQIVGALLEDDPQELVDWLLRNAPMFLASRLGSRRAHRKKWLPRTTFQRQASTFAGDKMTAPVLESSFAVTFVVDNKGTKKPVRKMTGDDHYFVAGYCRYVSKQALMHAAFHNELGRRLGDRTTAEVMTEVQYDELQASILKPTFRPKQRRLTA